MTYAIETHIEIEASAERVWSVLTDFASYPRWNPFIPSIEGPLEVGRRLKVFLRPPGQKGMWFRPVVHAAETNCEFRWKGQLFFPGLFDGEHYFRLEHTPGGGLTLKHGEIFSGILVSLFKKSLDGAVTQGFHAMNGALKLEAEQKEGGRPVISG